MQKFANNYCAIILGVLFFLLDRVTKIWTLTFGSASYTITSWLSLEYAMNKGIAWSLGSSLSPVVLLVLTTAVTVLTVILGLYWLTQNNTSSLFYPFTLIISGALGNVMDRLMYGGVIDFIVIHYKDWYFPTFNIADIAICCGALWWLIQEFRCLERGYE